MVGEGEESFKSPHSSSTEEEWVGMSKALTLMEEANQARLDIDEHVEAEKVCGAEKMRKEHHQSKHQSFQVKSKMQKKIHTMEDHSL